MAEPKPRTNLPEPLSGLPEPPLVELGGRPWLTRSEINRLVRRQALGPELARAWVVDELVQAIPLPQQREQDLLESWLQQQQLSEGPDLEAWLQRQHIDRDDLLQRLSQAERLDRFRRHRWGSEVELHFLRRKPHLDQVVYSLLRVSDHALAEELYQRVQEGEADFGSLAAQHAEGQERDSGGRIGPLPLTAAHPDIMNRLRVSQPGQLWRPFLVTSHWVLLRHEQLLPSRLDAETRARMMMELFNDWLAARVDLLLSGESLPPLPPLPSPNEELPPPP